MTDTATPIGFNAAHVASLRAAGPDDAEIADFTNGAAFFNAANRSIVSLTKPAAIAS